MQWTHLTYSFPRGHAINSTAFFLFFTNAPAIRGIGVCVSFGNAGFSEYEPCLFGAFYPADAIAGMIGGILLGTGYIVGLKRGFDKTTIILLKESTSRIANMFDKRYWIAV
ncbi:phosphatase PAP2 family protein [Thermaerobacillus caldiproteolyticus]|uniref:Uncharacterized protein n=1 Tax=Thermaerobacillus caldiproteolyticus TaxID=247480 RepID=A0A7V9Z7C5_9BACL|nr:hypothetical protein [Anoxybacillus caldiproteolyticus]MBA2875407.1 hypothetical protein [Anoxybacillus caldiproteolyticus]